MILVCLCPKKRKTRWITCLAICGAEKVYKDSTFENELYQFFFAFFLFLNCFSYPIYCCRCIFVVPGYQWFRILDTSVSPWTTLICLADELMILRTISVSTSIMVLFQSIELPVDFFMMRQLVFFPQNEIFSFKAVPSICWVFILFSLMLRCLDFIAIEKKNFIYLFICFCLQLSLPYTADEDDL